MQPDSSPYFSDDTPPEWGLAVADYVEQRAEQTERIDGREGEYIATLGDTAITEAFKVHAKLYSEAMWRWVSVEKVKAHTTWWEVMGGCLSYLDHKGSKAADRVAKDAL